MKIGLVGFPGSGRSTVFGALTGAETNPQLQAREYFETLEHPVVGAMPLPSFPFRFAGVERWLRTPAPTLGQHNEAVLVGVLGLSRAELRELEIEGVIGNRPAGL